MDSIFVLGGVFMAGIGGLFVVLGIVVIVRSHLTKRWPQVDGTVIFTEVQKKVSRHRGRSSVSYHPYIRYEYYVGGTIFQNDEFTAGMATSYHDPVAPEPILQNYPIGKQVTVFHSPSNPKKAVLIPGDSIGNWVFLLVGAAVLAGGLFMAGRSW